MEEFSNGLLTTVHLATAADRISKQIFPLVKPAHIKRARYITEFLITSPPPPPPPPPPQPPLPLAQHTALHFRSPDFNVEDGAKSVKKVTGRIRYSIINNQICNLPCELPFSTLIFGRFDKFFLPDIDPVNISEKVEICKE